MADFKLNYTTWDLEIEGGFLVEVTNWVDEVRQRVAIAIKTHLGEWALDTSIGLPWTEEILVKAPNLNQIRTRTQAYLLTVEGVTGVRRIDLSYDQVARTMAWTVDVETSEGVTGPFNVTVAL